MKKWMKWMLGALAGLSVLDWNGTASAELAISTEELPAATELVAYESVLAASGGVLPYSWTAVGEGYQEGAQTGTYAETGTAQGWQEDDGCWDLALPFAFPFFGNSYTQAKINSNGTISFGDDYFDYWSYEEEQFLGNPVIAVLWCDLATDYGDIYVETGSDWAKVRWDAEYLEGGAVNCSATLFADGRIVLAYGEGNDTGGFVGISAGDGGTTVVSAMSNAGSLENAADIMFAPQGLPEGIGLTEAGMLQGVPQEPGLFTFTAVVTDANGAAARRPLTLEVAGNPAIRPALAKTSPVQGYVNLKTATSKKFWVKATHPSGGTLSYEWSVDDGAVAGTKTNYTYRRTDTAMHTVQCTVSAADLARTVTAEWQVGVLTVAGPEDVTVSYGQNVLLQADVTSSLPVDVTWHDADGNEVGYGDALAVADIRATASYYAVATSALGTVTGRTATVTVDPAPAVGRIYKLTGAPFTGNRLVLRAKPYGDLTDASYSWKRDGVEVATTERLDIASLGTGDFGTYTLTVTTPLGTATSAGFVLEPAPTGVPIEWGKASAVPGGVTGVVQMDGGEGYDVALLADGTVTAWSRGEDEVCDVPEGLSGVSSVAAMEGDWGMAGFAVKTDGSVAAWGQTYEVVRYWDEEWEEWVTITNGVDLIGTMPESLENIVKVSVWGNSALALGADGNITAWGSGEQTILPEGLDDVVDIVAGNNVAFALKADGRVVAWGDAFDGGTAVPSTLGETVAIATSAGAGFALLADGTLSAWGDDSDWYGLRDIPVSDAAFIDVDGGSHYGVALDATRTVRVWGDTWNGEDEIPGWIQGNALGISACFSHSAAIVADSDGDSVADVLEPRYGRDPSVWEPWERVSVGGTVAVEGEAPAGSVKVLLLDAEGGTVGYAYADESGAWLVDGVLPGNYSLRVEAAGAVDVGMAGISTMDGPVAGLDFDLVPGEGVALAGVEAHLASDGEACSESSCSVVELPTGTAAYLDMWPVEPDGNGLIDLGEVADGPSTLDGTELLPHLVTVKHPETGAQMPVPAPVAGRESATVAANPHFSPESGSVRIVTDPAGAEVWVDYADAPLGVTPLTVGNLSAAASHAHILLLKKDGYLRPRPVEFRVEAGTEAEINIPLADASEPALSVAVESAIPGMEIHLDYLPTGEVTPATVTGLDTASYVGYLWESAPHSILLRHTQLRPFAPRALPDDVIWDEEAGGWLPSALSITAPSIYDDTDGDGVRNDVEVAAGTSPFDPAEYPVDQVTTFDGNGGTPAIQKTTNAMGVAYGTLPTPKWTGHIFLGWFTKAVGGEQVTAADMVTPAPARTLYAHWTDQQVTTFKGNGGKPSTQATTNTIYAEYGEMPVATRSGQAFLGWFNDPTEGKRVYETSKVTLAAARTLYAHWTDRQVTTFKGNGGKPATQKTTNTIYTAYGTFPEVEWAGHVFLGWFNSQTEGKQVYTNSKVTLAATRTLYARWADRQVVTLKGNGGSPSSKVVTNTIGAAYGALPAPKWSGHIFLGWFTAVAGGTEVTPEDPVTQATARTLYAHWTDRQVTTFLGNGGKPLAQVTTNTIYADYGVFPEAKWSGHALVGWFNAPEGGKRVYTNSTVTLAATRTLYAQWTTNQVTTFKGNGGTPATQKTTNTIYAAYGAFPEVKWSGHALVGWFNAPEGGKRVYTNSTVTLAATRTLYAQWTTNQVTTFKGNGGTPEIQKTTNAIYTAYGLFPEATWEGHVFQGWFNHPTSGKRVYTNSTVTLAATRTLYAHWTVAKALKALLISGMALDDGPDGGMAARAARAPEARGRVCTIRFEAEAGMEYEIQWTPSLVGEWRSLAGGTAVDEGTVEAEVELPADAPNGFFRVLLPSAE